MGTYWREQPDSSRRRLPFLVSGVASVACLKCILKTVGQRFFRHVMLAVPTASDDVAAECRRFRGVFEFAFQDLHIDTWRDGFIPTSRDTTRQDP